MQSVLVSGRLPKYYYYSSIAGSTSATTSRNKKGNVYDTHVKAQKLKNNSRIHKINAVLI